MDWFLVVKLSVIIFFFVMFLRRVSPIWGIGLLTVTTAVMLDAILGAFNREVLLAQLGFFYYLLSGALFAGAALWLWGVLRPLLDLSSANSPSPAAGATAFSAPPKKSNKKAPPSANPPPPPDTAFDRQMLYQQIHQRFGLSDILDLIFDLGFNENDVIHPHQETPQLIIAIMDMAEEKGVTGALTLAVERILAPLPPEQMPRREKLSQETPPNVLRHYLLAHYSQADLQKMSRQLRIDWEQLNQTNKKESARSLLLYLTRRGRLNELIQLIKQTPPANDASLAAKGDDNL